MGRVPASRRLRPPAPGPAGCRGLGSCVPELPLRANEPRLMGLRGLASPDPPEASLLRHADLLGPLGRDFFGTFLRNFSGKVPLKGRWSGPQNLSGPSPPLPFSWLLPS
jgi:hypothetical protein